MSDQSEESSFSVPTFSTPPEPVEEVVETPVEPEPEPEPMPKPSKAKKRSNKVVLEPGDNPSVIARRFLGRGSRAREVVAANPGIKWQPGVTITLPEDN